jgi:5-formyltetrahydrofolate cyclo-ligase
MGTSKEVLRNSAKAARAGLPADSQEQRSRRIMNNLLPVLDGTDPVMLYASKPPEVDTHPIIVTLLQDGKKVIVPIIEKETKGLRLSFLTDPRDLLPSTFGVPEPIGREYPVSPEVIGTVVVPMCAFDQSGHRLGYGAGYYDRFLSRHPGILKIGVAFSCQEVPCIPIDGNDVGMDLIVTEDGLRRIRFQ